MLATELIKKLQTIVDENGDMLVDRCDSDALYGKVISEVVFEKGNISILID